MSKKINPRRRPATQADISKAKREAQSQAINYAWAIFFTVLRDKEGFGKQRLARIWKEVNELSDSIAKGYINIIDLMHVLDAEANVVLGE